MRIVTLISMVAFLMVSGIAQAASNPNPITEYGRIPNPITEYGKLRPHPGPTAYKGSGGAHRAM